MDKQMVWAGEMDEKISLFKIERTQTATGSNKNVEILVFECWAAKKYKTTQKELDNKVIAANVVEFSIYWQPALQNENIQDLIIENGNERFEIFGFEPIGRKQFIKLNTQLRE